MRTNLVLAHDKPDGSIFHRDPIVSVKLEANHVQICGAPVLLPGSG